jgi:hypothetical protein
MALDYRLTKVKSPMKTFMIVLLLSFAGEAFADTGWAVFCDHSRN